MELNAEINKVVGVEMAKLISATISEKELQEQANKAWKELTHVETSYWGTYNNPSLIQKMVQDTLLVRMKAQVEQLLDSTEGQQTIRQQAEELIKQIQEKTKEKIVESISDRIASMTAGYQGYGLKNEIANVVHDMIRS